MPILIPLPEKLKNLETPIRLLIEQASQQLAFFECNGRRVDYQGAENGLSQIVGGIERAVHAAWLEGLVIDSPEVVIDGQRYRRVLESSGTYYTLSGPVSVVRPLFRSGRNQRTVDLVALRTGAVEGSWMPATATAMAHLMQQGTSREAEATAEQLGRCSYSRSAFEDVGHAVARAYQEDKMDIDDAWILQFEVPRKARSMSLSLDRVSVPIAVERPRPVGRPKHNAPKRPIEVVYRMAYCATLTLHDAKGRPLHTVRYGAAPGSEPSEMLERVLADAVTILRKRSNLKVALIADGAPEMWNLLRTTFTPELLGTKKVYEILDFYHLIEKLAPAAKVLMGNISNGLLNKWRLSLLNSSGAADRILKRLLRSGCRDEEVGEKRPVHEAITYLENHLELLDYANARSQGLPIGSGTVEATCKSLFNQRLKRSGARWSEQGAAEIIDLRAAALSDRWDFTTKTLFARNRKDIRLLA